MSRGTPLPRRPRRKATPLIAGSAARTRARNRWIPVALVATLVAGLIGVAALSTFDDPGATRPALRAGTTDRASWVLVPTGRSRAEVRDLLGAPRRTRPLAGDSECWLYGARSGRALAYELCFRGDFLSGKSVLPQRP